jgi:hypothetical protein
MASPVGATLLGVLEKLSHPGTPWFTSIEPNDSLIEKAARRVTSMTFAEFLDIAYMAAGQIGPWVSDADQSAADAYRHVDRRRPIAEAIASTFPDELHAPMDSDQQEWWTGDAKGGRFHKKFQDPTQTYGSGEFAWNGLWTVSSPPPEAHQGLIGAWELPRPVGRWEIPIHSESEAPSLFDVHRPEDWRRLVLDHPADATPRQTNWEMPGGQGALGRRSEIFTVDNQHAAIRSFSRHLVPNWSQVAQRYDGVHLSWAGWITTEGYVDVDDSGTAVMLRYWFSERTLWLADRFGDPSPLPRPAEESPASDAHEQIQQEHEREALRIMLGR